jgi:hypothetical protein
MPAKAGHTADQWPNDMRLSDLEPRFVCKACGKRGADARHRSLIGGGCRALDISGQSPVETKRADRGLNLGCVMECPVSWDRPFDRPVPLPSGPPARTLRDAANYIRKLPKSEYDTPEWRLAVQMLIDAAEYRGPMLFAKMGILRAIERSLNPPLRDPDCRRRKPARYR